MTLATITSAAVLAKSARLRYVACTGLGIRRIPSRRGFVYLLPNGRAVRDAARLEQIRSLALPPAWTDVWICLDPRGHLQATGYDARGRKQYRYHTAWRTVRDEVKYHELESFGACLPRLRRRLARDLASSALTKEKVLAAVITVMERTGLRVGNDRYVEENGSYGLTTLLDRHAHIRGAAVEFCFRGKGGKPIQVELRDRFLAGVVKRCRDIPGQRLFQYVAIDGSRQSISSTDVNRYLKQATGKDFSAKTFRTWTATVLALELLASRPLPESKTQTVRAINQVLREVANQRGNTPAICRKSYVDPRVITSFTNGALERTLNQVKPRAGLSRAESRLLQLLEAGPAAFTQAA